MGSPERWMTVEEVCRHLGVQPATVYAYASRGQLASRAAGGARRSEYDPADVERLARRGRRGSGAADLVLKTALTDTTAGLRYRGRDVSGLVGHHRYEQVAELLWTGDLPAAPPVWPVHGDMLDACLAARDALGGRGTPLDVLRAMVAAAATVDPFRGHLEPPAVLAAGRRLLATVVAALHGSSAGGPIAAALWAADGRPHDEAAVGVVDAALVLLADHGLAPSTLAVRVAASARTDPYGALLAGLAVVSGRRHGGTTRDIEEALTAALAAADPAATVARALDRGDHHLGFGLAIHPEGDPRAGALLDVLARSVSGEEARRRNVVGRVLDAVRDRGLPPPTVDLALAATTTVLGLPAGTAETLFAVGRMAGWIAHAVEQYGDDTLIRPRGVYVGP